MLHMRKYLPRSHTSVRRILAETGGIRPAQRRRSRLALTLEEREEISRGGHFDGVKPH
jgi:IS30 family transposase